MPGPSGKTTVFRRPSKSFLKLVVVPDPGLAQAKRDQGIDYLGKVINFKGILLPGGIAAGALFVIPSMFILFVLSYTYAAFGAIPRVAAAFMGLKAAVIDIVVSAVIKIGKKVIKNNVMFFLAVFSFVAIYFLKIPFPIIVLGAGMIGLLGSFFWPEKFEILKAKDALDVDAGYVQICTDPGECHITPSMGQNIRLILVFGLLWIFPVILINAFLPCFLFIFLGGPYIEKFRDNTRLFAALSSITAAVVGVVLNRAVWFGLQVLVPVPESFNGFAAGVGLAASRPGMNSKRGFYFIDFKGFFYMEGMGCL
jgi:chromate transport protein ChrA